MSGSREQDIPIRKLRARQLESPQTAGRKPAAHLHGRCADGPVHLQTAEHGVSGVCIFVLAPGPLAGSLLTPRVLFSCGQHTAHDGPLYKILLASVSDGAYGSVYFPPLPPFFKLLHTSIHWLVSPLDGYSALSSHCVPLLSQIARSHYNFASLVRRPCPHYRRPCWPFVRRERPSICPFEKRSLRQLLERTAAAASSTRSQRKDNKTQASPAARLLVMTTTWSTQEASACC